MLTPSSTPKGERAGTWFDRRWNPADGPLPLKWRKACRVLVEGDLFAHGVSDETRDTVFAVAELTEHVIIVPTAHPGRMAEWLNADECRPSIVGMISLLWDKRGGHRYLRSQADAVQWPIKHAIPATHVSTQAEADERIKHLLNCPAAGRVLIVEPREGIDLREWLPNDRWYFARCGKCGYAASSERFAVHNLGDDSEAYCRHCYSRDVIEADRDGIHGLIVRGGSEPVHPDNVRSLRDQCAAAGVPFMFTGWGEYGAGSEDMTTGLPVFRSFPDKLTWINKARTWVNGGTCIDMAGKVMRNGGDFDSAAYPVAIVHKLGSAHSGRLLDGVEHNELPALLKGASDA